MFRKLKDIFEVVKETLAPPNPFANDYESERERLLLQEKALRAFHEAGKDEEKLLAAGDLIDQCRTNDNPNLAFAYLVELHPDNAEYHARLGASIFRYGAGNRCGCDPLDPKVQEVGLHHLRHAIDLDPDNLMAHETLAVSYSELLQDAEEADQPTEALRENVIHHYRRVTKVDPRNAEARIDLANYLTEAGRFDEAEPYIESYLALSTKAHRWKRAAGAYTLAGQHEKAQELELKFKQE